MDEQVIVDTNVLLAGTAKADHLSVDCILKCIETLAEIKKNCRLVLDRSGNILEEYRKKIKAIGSPLTPGQSFLVWIFENNYNPVHCKLVDIHPSGDDRKYLEFPDAADLVGFDPSDKKFVAVAIASGDNPPILFASDRGWIRYRAALENNNVSVRELCPT